MAGVSGARDPATDDPGGRVHHPGGTAYSARKSVLPRAPVEIGLTPVIPGSDTGLEPMSALNPAAVRRG